MVVAASVVRVVAVVKVVGPTSVVVCVDVVVVMVVVVVVVLVVVKFSGSTTGGMSKSVSHSNEMLLITIMPWGAPSVIESTSPSSKGKVSVAEVVPDFATPTTTRFTATDTIPRSSRLP